MKRTIILGVVAAALAAGAAVLLLGGSDDVPPVTTAAAAPPTGAATTTSITTEPAELPLGIASAVDVWETDWSRRTIDLDELILGIPASDPRDMIAPLDSPKYETLETADDWLAGAEVGVMFQMGEATRFYPLRILTAHEVVNDVIDDVPFAITYCPLCNTAAAFDRRVDGEVLRFGVSGLLRRSDLVMWDRESQSLWQQITGEGIVGQHAGDQLEFLPTSLVTWADFKAAHPGGLSLSRDTGFRFGYGSNGYTGYTRQNGPFTRFFPDEVDGRFPALERVVGVRVGEAAKAYPFSVLREERVADDVIDGTPVTVWWADTGAADSFDSSVPGEGRVIGTGVAFLSTVEGRVLTFDPAGSDRFRDRETGTIWNLFGLAVEGPLAGTQLSMALHQNEFWFAWAAFNPGSPVHGA